ncbi:hypothetical protein [Renibacterium salmoninarum]|uniref:hypothetical protein n=1 Tax=Renibacterium salmoninarum TaxID=1646 RepID=UPI002155077D|nr:hypothetical protein [Renibacterium salmoninarum]
MPCPDPLKQESLRTHRGDSWLKGDWNLSGQYITPTGASAQIKFNYHAKNVYIVVAGEGNITVTDNGSSKQVKVSGTPTLYPI